MMEVVSIWAIFIFSAVMEEMESPVSAIAASVLGFLAFMLVFSFSMVIALIVALDRTDARLIRVLQQSQVDLLNDMGSPTGAIPLPSP